MKSQTGSFPYMVTNNTRSVKTIEAKKLLGFFFLITVVQSFDMRQSNSYIFNVFLKLGWVLKCRALDSLLTGHVYNKPILNVH